MGPNPKRIYVVGPRPMYPNDSSVRLEEGIIVSASSDTEARAAREKAMSLSKALARLGYTKISAHTISARQVRAFEKRGATDRRVS
jgi:hypothetical protein